MKYKWKGLPQKDKKKGKKDKNVDPWDGAQHTNCFDHLQANAETVSVTKTLLHIQRALSQATGLVCRYLDDVSLPIQMGPSHLNLERSFRLQTLCGRVLAAGSQVIGNVLDPFLKDSHSSLT